MQQITLVDRTYQVINNHRYKIVKYDKESDSYVLENTDHKWMKMIIPRAKFIEMLEKDTIIHRIGKVVF